MAKINGTSGKVITSANQTITGASGTTTIVVLDATADQSVGDRVLIEGVVGMTDLNGEHTVTAVSAGVSFSVVLSPATGQTYISGGTVKDCVSITNWTLDINSDVIDTTDSSATTWNTFIASGFKGGSGTFDAFFIGGANDLALGSSTTLILRMDASNYYTCTAFITGNSSTTDVPGADAVKKTYTFNTTSTITLTAA